MMNGAVRSGLVVVVLAGLAAIGYAWELMRRHLDRQADDRYRRACDRSARRWPPT